MSPPSCCVLKKRIDLFSLPRAILISQELPKTPSGVKKEIILNKRHQPQGHHSLNVVGEHVVTSTPLYLFKEIKILGFPSWKHKMPLGSLMPPKDNINYTSKNFK